MPAYHSTFNDALDVRQVGNMSVLPIKTKIRGPAPSMTDSSEVDIIDETLDLFRANSLFRNFEIKGGADRLLIVLILFISDCLAKLSQPRTPPSQIEATKQLNTLAVDNFPLPGDVTFPLNSHYAAPATRPDSGRSVRKPLNGRHESSPYWPRLSASIPHASPTGACRTACGTVIR
ncbi:subunit of the Arp2/3 complex [Tulasnella sp. JGI-2019a]|nr:subunit of the Arp2/3 complex [Tulasnella sp. JGI-2019a]